MPDKDWKITLEYVETASGRLEDTTFTIRETAPAGFGNLDGNTVASDISSWLAVKARAMATSFVLLARVRANHGGPYGPGEGDPPESGEYPTNQAGTMAAGSGTLPHGVCARVTVRTDLASRRGTGRFHAPSPTAASYLATADDWNQSGAYYLAVSAFATELLGGKDVSHDVVVHHYSLRVHSRADGVTRDAKVVIPRTQVSYIRSRLSAP